MNDYRVDRADSLYTPCGMNSIVLITSNQREAELVFNHTKPGLNAWNKPDPRYGVLLSKWSALANNYLPLKFKHNGESK
jgi:hypothetical protein